LVRWTNNPGISAKIMMMLAIPAMAILVLVARGALEQNQVLQHSVHAKQIIELVSKIDRVAHQLAKERGITENSVSKEANNYQQMLSSARSETDIAVAHLEQFIKIEEFTLLNSDNQERIAEIDEYLNKRHSIRIEIENRGDIQDSFFRYSAINAFLLDIVQRLAVTVDDREMLKQTSAMATLLWMKELAGQERGLVTAILAEQTVSIENYILIKGYVIEQATASNDFIRNASDKQRTRFLQLMGEVESPQFNTMRDIIEPRMIELRTVIDPQVWFETATIRIDGIKDIAVLVADDISQLAADRYRRVKRELMVLMFSFLLLLGGPLLISYLMGRRLALEITRSANRIREIERAGDLSLRLEIKNLDEVGRMGNAVNRLCESLERAVSDVNRVVGAMAKGDFSQKIDREYKGELNNLKKGVNAAVDRVNRFHKFSRKNKKKTVS